ncbi:MAG TPA: HAMP domain-containing sensor histidine kinase [Chloroflexota bacterium]|nr:HAMP domain-containing sensor histidine kinase [Chloroflexota bacterium]
MTVRLFPNRERSPKGDESLLRRIGWQLAAVTSLLLFVLVIAMALAVFLQTRDALLQPLRHAVVNRAYIEASELASGHSAPPPPHGGSPSGGSRSHGGFGPSTRLAPGEEGFEDGVFLTVTDSHYHILHSTAGGPTGASGHRIADMGAMRQARDAENGFFTTVQYRGSSYLAFTEPVFRSRTDDRLAGFVQTLTSETGYVADIRSLVNILVVVAVLGLVGTLAITAFVVRRALRPIRLSLERQRNFVAEAAHELRTPLTIIRSSAEMAVDSDDSDEQQRAELTLRETSHLTRLVNDLSFLARADSGVMQFRREVVDVKFLITQTVSDLAVLAEERNVSLETRLESDVHLVADPDRLRQLLLILVDNALKHTPDGGSVRIDLHASRRHVSMRVHDSGPGIQPADLPHIFDRFYQSDRSRTAEGTGLGLAIAQSIGVGLGGSITAANDPDGGAVFTVNLPAGQSLATAAAL